LHYTSITFPNDTNKYMALNPSLFTDAPVNCLAKAGVDIYFGGEFVLNNNYDTLNHVGHLQLLTTSIKEKVKLKNTISAFPNPTTHSIMLQCNNTSEIITGYEVYDVTGKIVMQESINASQESILLKHLSSGLYTIKVSMRNSIEIVRLAKQ
jgi:hypothetical protein